MKKIGIFCSAADTIQPIYFEKAEELGVWLGQNQKTLVYGGANIGLMECVAQAARKHGALIMGVVPTKLEDRGAVSDLLEGEKALKKRAVMCRNGIALVMVPLDNSTVESLIFL